MPALIRDSGPGQTCASACRVEPEEAVSWYPSNIGFECLQHLAGNAHEACLLKHSCQPSGTTAKSVQALVSLIFEMAVWCNLYDSGVKMGECFDMVVFDNCCQSRAP